MEVNNVEFEKNVDETANAPLLANEPSVPRSAMASEVARRLADTCVKTKEWDEKNYNIAQKTVDMTESAKEKWHGLDEKYKLEDKMISAANSTIVKMKSIDETHQITRRLTDKAKDWDEKYEISTKVDKVRNDETVQNVCGKVTRAFTFGWGFVVDVATETKERVNEAERNKAPTTEGGPTPNNEKVITSVPSQAEGNATPGFSNTNVE